MKILQVLFTYAWTLVVWPKTENDANKRYRCFTTTSKFWYFFHKNISRLCTLPNCCGHEECMLGFKKHVHMFAKWNWWHSHFLLEFILVMDASPLANKKTAEIYRFSQKVCSRLDISRVLSLQAILLGVCAGRVLYCVRTQGYWPCTQVLLFLVHQKHVEAN